MSLCNFCPDIIAITIIVSIVLKLSCKQIFLFCQMALYEKFKMSDNFNKFHQYYVVLGGGFVDFQQC